MRKTYRYAAVCLVILMVTLACSISFGGDEDEDTAIQTAIAQTMAAEQGAATNTPESTFTVAPADTQAVPPTETPKPCNAAYFESETIPDGTEFETGESFTKTWRIRNIGTCTWNTNYELLFSSGDQMGGPNSKNLTQSVAPNEVVDVAVDLEAPTSEGTYKGIWNIADDGGTTFVNNIWVEIVAVEPAVPEEPDLTITGFTLDPEIPTKGENVHVRVRAHNAGTADSGGFKMEWYGLSTFTNPSCSWNIAGGLVASGSVWMECDFTFASWYPINRTTIAYIDVDDQVDESDESNNSSSISPFGVYDTP